MADSLSLLIKSAFDASGVTAATNSINKMDSQISRVSKSLTKLTGLFAGGSLGAAVLVYAKSSVDAFAKEERAISLRNQALLNLGITDRAVARDLDNMAESMEKMVRAEKEDILAVQTSLIQRGLYGAELQKAIPTVLDLATKTGSLSGAADIVGKAFQGVARGLNTVGVIIPANTDKTKVYAEAMRQLNEMYGGSAQAEMDNIAGRQEILGKRFDDMNKRMGALLAGPASGIISWLESLATVLERLTAPGSDARLEGLQERIGMLQAHLTKLKGPKTGFWDWLDRSPEAIRKTENDIKKIQALINDATRAEKSAGGSTKPTRPVGALANDDAEREKAAKKAEEDARRQAAILAQMDEFYLSQRGQMYARFFGKTALDSKRSYLAQAKSADEMKERHKQVLQELANAYENAGQTVGGGFRQAYLEMGASLNNWRANWEQVISGSILPAQQALKDFFNQGNSGFLNWAKLAEKTFKGILNAFYDMLTQMAAKAAIYGIFSMFGGGGLLGGSLGKFLSRASGGPIPGQEGAPTPILAHGGEFVLSANVVKAIKSGAPTSGLTPSMSSAGGGGGNVITNNITLAGSPSDTDISRICEKITEATRAGMRQAGEMANVLTKTGTKKAGLTGL